MRFTKFLLITLIGLLFAGCQATEPETIIITTTPLPTYTPLPTLMSLPTYTPLPTLMPLPTYTPEQSSSSGTNAFEEPEVAVVIAIQDIPAGTEIQSDRVVVVLYPASVVPRGSFDNIGAIIGTYARTDIYAQEIILARKLVESNDEEFLGRELIPVPIANRDIVAGEQFTDENYHIAWIESFELEEIGITALVEIPLLVGGGTAAVDIEANTPILADDME